MWLGAEIAWRFRVRNRRADAYVCAVALVGSAPFLYGSLVLASINIKVTYVSIVQQLSVLTKIPFMLA